MDVALYLHINKKSDDDDDDDDDVDVQKFWTCMVL